MLRAHCYLLPGDVWHRVQRCDCKPVLLKLARDLALVGWLQAARRRDGLCVLDYTVTCNRVHLLVRDQGRGERARSLQPSAGQTGQAFNQRKQRPGVCGRSSRHAVRMEPGPT